jgi:hypothetical protein
MRLALCELDNAGDGFFHIASPFVSHGVFYLQANRDSVRITTTSDDGDRIVWSAQRVGDVLIGGYKLIRGQSAARRGAWRVTLVAGQPIPMSVHAWR